jgi:hypothetical protein
MTFGRCRGSFSPALSREMRSVLAATAAICVVGSSLLVVLATLVDPSGARWLVSVVVLVLGVAAYARTVAQVTGRRTAELLTGPSTPIALVVGTAGLVVVYVIAIQPRTGLTMASWFVATLVAWLLTDLVGGRLRRRG